VWATSAQLSFVFDFTLVRQNNLREEKLFSLWFQGFQSTMVRAWWSTAAHTKVDRKQRDRIAILEGLLFNPPNPPVFCHGPQCTGWFCPHSECVFPSLVNPFWKCYHRHTRRYNLIIFWASIGPVKLTTKINQVDLWFNLTPKRISLNPLNHNIPPLGNQKVHVCLIMQNAFSSSTRVP
jgi:hypothetical protein